MIDSKTLDLAALLEQEERLQFSTFGYDDAWRLGGQLVDRARELSLAVTIDITRATQQLFHAALPGTCADNDEWLRRKVRAVYRFGHSTYYLGRTYTDKGALFDVEPHWDHLLYAAHGGGFPLSIRGVGVVGTIGVSGLPQDQDHSLIVDVLESFLAAPAHA